MTGDMRVLLSGSSLNNWDHVNGSATTMVGLPNALTETGVEVTWLEPGPVDEIKRVWGIQVVNQFDYNSPEDLARELPADLLIFQNYAHDFSRVARAYRNQGSRVFLLDDNTPKQLRSTIATAKSVDVILSHGPDPAKILRHYLPSTEIVVFEQATDPKRFAPVEEEDKKFCWDVLFVGAADPLRRDVLEFLFFGPARRMPQFTFGLYGIGWENFLEHSENVVYGGWIDNDHLAETYARAKVVVHGTTRPLRPFDLVVNRVYDVMATGSVVLADRTKGLGRAFTPGEQIVLASDTDEATDWIRSLVADRERRRRIAAAGRSAVLQCHTWAHRVKEIEAIYSTLKRTS